MKKPLIALFTNNDDDVYCFRLELIQAIIAAGYQFLISCPDGPKFELMEALGLKKDKDFIYDDPPIDRRGTSILKDWALIVHYRKVIKKYRPAVILAYTAKPNVYVSIIAHQYHIPVINNITGLGSVLKETGLKKALIMYLFKTAYKRSACIMFQNEANMKLAKELGWVKGKSILIPGSGVALNRFPLQEYPDGGDGIKGNPIVFNYIGRILHDKGVDDYIEAAKTIKPRFPNTEFNMIGFIEPSENHYVDELNELQRQGIVYYRGSQNDVKPWVIRSHAIIHPSIYGEGMSNVLLENASSGRLIITTDNPGCKETVLDGVSGFIYEGGNLEQLIKLVIKVIKMKNEDRKKMGLAGRKKVEKEFSREIVITAYLETISSLLSTR